MGKSFGANVLFQPFKREFSECLTAVPSSSRQSIRACIETRGKATLWPMNPRETSIRSVGDWQLIQRLECPQCTKRYAVAVWKSSSKCRQCGIELRPTNPPAKPHAK